MGEAQSPSPPVRARLTDVHRRDTFALPHTVNGWSERSVKAVASLQARSPLRSAHLLLFLNKLVSFVALIVLLAVGWMAVSYLRAELVSREPAPGDDGAVSTSSRPAVERSEITPIEMKTVAPLRLVYSCAADTEHYHTQAHLPSNCARTALSEEAAARRGLKRCLFCLRK